MHEPRVLLREGSVRSNDWDEFLDTTLSFSWRQTRVRFPKHYVLSELLASEELQKISYPKLVKSIKSNDINKSDVHQCSVGLAFLRHEPRPIKYSSNPSKTEEEWERRKWVLVRDITSWEEKFFPFEGSQTVPARLSGRSTFEGW
jgi:hypothetical protein